jgi:hypothetical protein
LAAPNPCYPSQQELGAADRVKQILAKAFVGLLGALALLYVGDWSVWRSRVAMGGGMGTVSVSRIVVVTLKNNKEEYYWDGASNADCSRSIFPQAGSGACWWLARHKVIYER